MDLLYRLGRILSFIFLPIFGQVQVIGRHHIPREGGFIIACNHQSIADPPLIVYSINRPVFFMAKKSLFKTRAISRMLRALHVYPVNRTGVDIEAIKWAQAILTKGHVLLIFPEGTRSPFHLSKGNDGIAYIAMQAKVPVVPVGITGTESITSVIRIPFHFKKVKVFIGEPFYLEARDTKLERSVLTHNTELVMRSIAQLLPPNYRGEYLGNND